MQDETTHKILSAKKMTLMALLSCTLGLMSSLYAMAFSAQGVRDTTLTQQGRLVEHVREPVLRDQIENRLCHMHAAVRVGNVGDVGRHQRHLLEHIRRNPDILWQSYKTDEYPAETKLIDLMAPFLLALMGKPEYRPSLDQWAERVSHSELARLLSDTFNSCLLLSTRCILGPKPCQGYLRQLIDDQYNTSWWTKTLQAKLKIQLTLEYLGTAARYDALTQVAPQTLPDDLMSLIATFCFGATPRTRAQTKKEVIHMEARKRLRWHELGLFSKNRMQGFVVNRSRASPFPLMQDKKILRAFVWAGLTEKDLYAQLNRPFQQSLDEYCSENDRSFRETLQSKQQIFLEQWPQLVQAINDARLSFEEGIDDLPDIIPACNAEANTSS